MALYLPSLTPCVALYWPCTCQQASTRQRPGPRCATTVRQHSRGRPKHLPPSICRQKLPRIAIACCTPPKRRGIPMVQGARSCGSGDHRSRELAGPFVCPATFVRLRSTNPKLLWRILHDISRWRKRNFICQSTRVHCITYTLVALFKTLSPVNGSSSDFSG